MGFDAAIALKCLARLAYINKVLKQLIKFTLRFGLR